MIDIKTRELAILVIGPFNDPFDYILEDSSINVAMGQIVEVLFGRKKTVGVVVGKGTGKIPGEKLKKIDKIFEITTEKEDFYKIKTELEKKIETFNYSSIEWRPLNYVDLNKDQSEQIVEVLTALEELDDVQNIFTNANLKNLQL